MSKVAIDDWTELIEQGIRYKEKYGDAKRWHTYREYGRGKFPGYTSATGGILPYNLVHSIQRSMVPNIYFRNPYINVSPRFDPTLHINAKIVESVDNWLLMEMNMKATFKTMVSDAYYCNRGIAKIGYDALNLGAGTPVKGVNEELAELLNTPITHLGKKRGERVEYNVNVKPGMPWTERVMAEFFVVPFGVRTLDDCPWADHIVIRPLADVKNDPKYKNTRELEGTHMEMMYRENHAADFYKELSSHVDMVEIHEIRDFKRKEIKAFVPGYDKWIREPQEDVLQYEGLPFIDFTFNEDGEYYWGPSDVQIIEPQQLEINEARTQAMLHRRVALLKFLVEEKGMDPKEVDKMISETVGPVAFTKGKPSEVVALLQPHIPADLTQWSEIIRSDVRELLGQGRQQSGEAPPGRRTAREMDIVQQAHDSRMGERRDIVGDALQRAIRKINQVVFDKWTAEKVVQVVGYDGARYWIKHTGKSLVGEYNYKVDVESMVPSTKRVKKREILELVQVLAKNPRANIDYLLRMLIREYDWIDAMKVLPEAPESAEGPMPQGQFTQMQNEMLRDPQMLQERAGKNAQMMGRMF